MGTDAAAGPPPELGAQATTMWTKKQRHAAALLIELQGTIEL